MVAMAVVIIAIIFLERNNLVINKSYLPPDPKEDLELYQIDVMPPGFRGKQSGIGSWFRANHVDDTTNGNSWCQYPYKNYTIGFAIDLDQMRRSPLGGKEYCGLEAFVFNPKTNKSLILYVSDAFDPKWVKSPGSIDIMVESFQYLTNGAPLVKNNVIFDIQWEFTGNKSRKYSYDNRGDV